MTRVEIEVKVTVNPTESEEKVRTAVTNVLGNMEFEVEPQREAKILQGRMTGINSLQRFKNLLARMRIRDAARRLFLRRSDSGTLSFGLNKQAAYVGRVSFTREGESPLGPIQVILKGDVEQVINFLTSKEQRRGSKKRR